MVPDLLAPTEEMRERACTVQPDLLAVKEYLRKEQEKANNKISNKRRQLSCRESRRAAAFLLIFYVDFTKKEKQNLQYRQWRCSDLLGFDWISAVFRDHCGDGCHQRKASGCQLSEGI